MKKLFILTSVVVALVLLGVLLLVFLPLGSKTSSLADAVVLDDDAIFPLEARMVERVIADKTIEMFAYNGEVPGPILHVKQGSTLTVPFTNNLSEPTTVHWHGVRVDNQFDGVLG